MRAIRRRAIVLLLVSSLLAPTPAAAAKKKRGLQVDPDVQALKAAVAAQQQQIQALQQQLEETSQQLRQTSQQFQSVQQQIQQAQQAAAAAESETASKDSVDQLSSELAGVQSTLSAHAFAEQDQQRRFARLEDVLGRFHWAGDVRVRGDSILQNYGGCALCNDRNRARVRIRFGFEGKLNQDFTAGIALATGSLSDPTTTNQTMNNFFERKAIALDRGYVTYNPAAHRWLSLTAGKFPYTWQRTSMTFDSDINPEGFVEKFSRDFSSVPIVKNINLQFMQLLYNEVTGTTSSTQGVYGKGRDSFAVGGQIAGQLQPLSFWSLTPSFTLLNFRYPDALLNASAFQVGATSSGFVLPGTTTTVTFPIYAQGPGCAPVQSSGLPDYAPCAFAPNGMTNATYTDANNVLHFLSSFLYADLILNNQFRTGWERLPLNVLLEYENNLNAAPHPLTYANTNTSSALNDQFASRSAAQAAGAANLGKQSHAYLADISIGQQKKLGDILVGYAFLRQEQDSVIASWGESEQRAPTNVLQHRFYALLRIAPNTTASLTWWHGRSLNPYLQNAALAPGMKVSVTPGTGVLVPGSGAQEPWLNRVQFDVIYTF